MALTFGSLFAGIGGLDLGLERAGMRCLWQVEIDEYCRRVLAKHWPDVPKFGDIQELRGDELQRVDLICGGFPCQDISNAGKRAGIGGERSGLWSEYIRLVRVLRPRFVLVENVAALLGRGMDTVLGDLAASGYDAEWDCVSARAVGAPHIRERIFVLAYTAGCESGERFEPDVQRRRTNDSKQIGLGCCGISGAVADASCIQLRPESCAGTDAPRHPGARTVSTEYAILAHPDRQSLAVGEVFGGNARAELTAFERSCRARGGQWAAEPAVGRVANGIPGRMDRLRGLGNAVVPQIAEFIGRRIMEVA
ncbi:MAG: DNA cytosine methyltransferase [Thermomicrobiales bacterium]